MKKGKLFIVSGPSGTGKGAICRRILAEDPDLRFSVSVSEEHCSIFESIRDE